MYLTIALGSFVQESYPGLMNLTAVAGIPPTWLWVIVLLIYCWFFSSRRRHTRLVSDWVQTCALPIRSEEHTSELQSLTNLVCRLIRSEEHTSELQSLTNLVCRLLLEKKYKVVRSSGEEVDVHSPYDMPDRAYVLAVKEPWVKLELLTPKEYTGAIMKLVQDRRGINKSINYLNESRVLLDFEAPLSSIVVDFYDKLKSISSGYASMNYEFIDFREGDLVKVDILVSGDPVPPLAMIVHKSESYAAGCKVTKLLKDLIPRANFLITLQAAIGGKIIAREDISAYRKDVTGYLYGGDRTRKDKLLKKQKEGKKRMKMVGKVNVPQEAFMAVLKR